MIGVLLEEQLYRGDYEGVGEYETIIQGIYEKYKKDSGK